MALSLLDAASIGDEGIVAISVQNGLNLDEVDYRGWTALVGASFYGHTRCAEILLQHGANVHCATATLGWTALHAAIEANRKTIVSLLLQFGADVTALNRAHETPLRRALKCGFGEIAEQLLKHMAISQLLHKVFFQAASEGDVQSVYAVAQVPGFLMNATDPANGHTALHLAALNGHEEMVSVLLAMDVLPSPKNLNGQTPLHYAAHNAFLPIVDLLLGKVGIDIDAQEASGATPLHYAVAECHPQIVQRLVRAGANVNVRDSQHRTPADLLANLKKPETRFYIESALQPPAAFSDASLLDGFPANPLASTSTAHHQHAVSFSEQPLTAARSFSEQPLTAARSFSEQPLTAARPLADQVWAAANLPVSPENLVATGSRGGSRTHSRSGSTSTVHPPNSTTATSAHATSATYLTSSANNDVFPAGAAPSKAIAALANWRPPLAPNAATSAPSHVLVANVPASQDLTQFIDIGGSRAFPTAAAVTGLYTTPPQDNEDDDDDDDEFVEFLLPQQLQDKLRGIPIHRTGDKKDDEQAPVRQPPCDSDSVSDNSTLSQKPTTEVKESPQNQAPKSWTDNLPADTAAIALTNPEHLNCVQVIQLLSALKAPKAALDAFTDRNVDGKCLWKKFLLSDDFLADNGVEDAADREHIRRIVSDIRNTLPHHT